CFSPGGEQCSANATENLAFCAYHTCIPVGSTYIIWSNDPYVYEKNCDEAGHHPQGNGDAFLLGGGSHEHSESITDPLLNAWKNAEGAEIGDICRTFEPNREFG